MKTKILYKIWKFSQNKLTPIWVKLSDCSYIFILIQCNLLQSSFVLLVKGFQKK